MRQVLCHLGKTVGEAGETAHSQPHCETVGLIIGSGNVFQVMAAGKFQLVKTNFIHHNDPVFSPFNTGSFFPDSRDFNASIFKIIDFVSRRIDFYTG